MEVLSSRPLDEDQVKDKGGLNTVCILYYKLSYVYTEATKKSPAEQRKQRNRQAQAAFRERRTEYIKELEEEASTHKAEIKRLEEARSQAVDECLMLRYKNSLLERILLEKGRKI